MLFKNWIFLIFLTALSGCGFEPLYSGDCANRQPLVLHFKGEGAAAYKFRRELEKQLSIVPKFDEKTYQIDLTLAEAKSASTYAQDATITRTQITMTAIYTIRMNDQTIARGSNDLTTSFPVISSDAFATQNADIAAANRVAISLAEEVSRDILRLIKIKSTKNG